MRSSYRSEDVTLLLKDITGLVEPLPASERERRIQSGTHYCEMLPLEYTPTEAYMEAYRQALKNYAKAVAEATGVLAQKLYQRKGKSLVIVSLARAGIPIGILLKRYLREKYGADVPHYAISIIRGRGIDRNAVNYILERHDPSSVQFIDGWIGKGAILGQLRDALREYPQLDASLGVISDPAELTDLCGTHQDILIPSSCLNSTVSGLISRTFLRSDLIGENDFHGAAYYSELAPHDLSEEFLQAVGKFFCFEDIPDTPEKLLSGSSEIIRSIQEAYHIGDINFIKPGIGEATRVLLRRIPWKVIVNEMFSGADELRHITQLAAEKGVPCEISRVPLGNYKVCGLIRQLSDI
ncbi:MAG: cysteine protease StiP family protein [Oscillospiraceae bacterium]|nr:cysteine protease StiP family protein [Oscillospiraceae bacterium]